MAWVYIFRLGKFEITSINELRPHDWSSSYLISPENQAHSKYSKLSVDLSSAKDSCEGWMLI